jgi:hypothetical protein
MAKGNNNNGDIPKKDPELEAFKMWSAFGTGLSQNISQLMTLRSGYDITESQREFREREGITFAPSAPKYVIGAPPAGVKVDTGKYVLLAVAGIGVLGVIWLLSG